jgi:hypothetical protein
VPLAEALLAVPADLIGTALALELAEGTVTADHVGESACIFLTRLYRAERAIAERVLALTRAPLPWGTIDADKAVPWIEQRIGLDLAATQRSAVRLALASKVLVITGGPGVGKTTIVKAILGILAAKRVKILLGAPTGRAAKRLNETTGYEAKTIHRLLEVDPKGGELAQWAAETEIETGQGAARRGGSWKVILASGESENEVLKVYEAVRAAGFVAELDARRRAGRRDYTVRIANLPSETEAQALADRLVGNYGIVGAPRVAP